jgi:hypothetical protein
MAVSEVMQVLAGGSKQFAVVPTARLSLAMGLAWRIQGQRPKNDGMQGTGQIGLFRAKLHRENVCYFIKSKDPLDFSCYGNPLTHVCHPLD